VNPLEIESYDLKLDVDFERARVRGVVDVSLKRGEAPLVLDAVGLDVSSVRASGRDLPFRLDSSRGTLTIPGAPSGPCSVEIAYSKQVSDEVIFGLYKSKYDGGYLLVTDLEPAEARTVFPCKDHPAFKAVFRLEVTTDSGLKVISNTPVASVVADGAGRSRFVFEPTPKMSTYLFFLGVGRFDEAHETSGKLKVILAARPAQAAKGRFAIGIASRVVSWYGDYFGIPYPLKKLHLVGLPEYHVGAMENWGAITSREAYALIDKHASFAERRRSARLWAHEIAHMWFGDLVTMKWWDDLWLNESFATFMEDKAMDRLQPKWDVWREFIRLNTFRSLNADSLFTTHPIHVEVKTLDEMGSVFDAISYGKGAAVLRMMEEYVGEESFRKGVSAYLKKFSYSNAEGEDLWKSLEEASGLPVSRVMHAWVTKPGFPLIDVKTSKGQITLAQSRFLLRGGSSKDLWPVPLTLRLDGKEQSILLDREVQTMKARKQTDVLVNLRRKGFYAVKYDDETYDSLARRFRMMHPHDEAGLVSDLYLLMQAGLVAPTLYFRFVSLCSKVGDPLVVETVNEELTNLRALAEEARIVRDAQSEFYASQMARVGLKAKKNQDETMSAVRELLAPQAVRTDPACAKRLARLFDDYQDVPADLKSAVAISYALSKREAAYGRLVQLLKNQETEGGRVKLYPALTSFRETNLVERTLELAISGEVSRSDATYAIGGAGLNPFAREALWRWLVKRYDRVCEIYANSQAFYTLLNNVLPVCGIGHESEVRKFISGERYRRGELTFRRTFEMMEVNCRLRRALLTS
jgi:tricorn protease interacting factor F2/3